MTDAPVQAITDRLWSAQMSSEPCAAPSDDHPDFDVETAYAVQHRLIRRRCTRQGLHGRPARPVGRKIGLTSAAIRDWLGVDEPDFGVLLDDMVVGDGMTTPPGVLLQPRIEAEVAFVLGDDLTAPTTAADVLRATDYVVPALEIIDSRIADWDITYEDTIADNASSGLFVLGNRPRKLTEIDLRVAGMKLAVDGDVVSTGAGAACMQHPVNAVVWLADKLAEFGQTLQAGEIVLSGAVGPAVDVEPGHHVRADISGLGTVSVHIGE